MHGQVPRRSDSRTEGVPVASRRPYLVELAIHQARVDGIDDEVLQLAHVAAVPDEQVVGVVSVFCAM